MQSGRERPCIVILKKTPLECDCNTQDCNTQDPVDTYSGQEKVARVPHLALPTLSLNEIQNVFQLRSIEYSHKGMSASSKKYLLERW